jgi:hypothetical protein
MGVKLSLTLRVKNRLRVFENRVLAVIFGHEKKGHYIKAHSITSSIIWS